MPGPRPSSRPPRGGLEPPRPPAAPTRFFYDLTPDRILAAFGQAGIRCRPAVRFLNSLENRVARVEDEDGALFVGKFYRPGRHDRASLLEEHAFLQELDRAGVPVVPPIPLGATGETVGETGGIHFAIFPHRPGRPPDEIEPARVEALGDVLGRIHAVGCRSESIHRRPWNPADLGEAELDLLGREGGLPAEVRDRYIRTARRLLAHLRPRLAGAPALRIHGDFHRGNLLWSASGPTVVDFDDMGRGPAVQDVWMLIPDRGPEGAQMRDALVRAYERHLEFEWETLDLVEPLRAFRYIRYAAWLAARREDPAFIRVLHDFGSRAWWQRELSDLEAQVSLFA